MKASFTAPKSKSFSFFSLLALILSLNANTILHSTTKNILVSDIGFVPSNLIATVGDTVRWTLTGSFEQSTTCDGIFPGTSHPAGASSWNAHLTGSNPVFEYKLTMAGTYNYASTYSSPDMTGSIIANAPLPVELTDFVATTIKNEVILDWFTGNEFNNDKFEVQRVEIEDLKDHRENDLPFFTIGILRGNGTSTNGHHYKFVDRNLKTGRYMYRLKQVDFNSNYIYHMLNGEVIVGVPVKFSVSQNYPNPFNPTTIISYEIPADGNVKIALYDVNGKEAAVPFDNYQTAGYQSIEINGFNLPSGVYFYRIDYKNDLKSFSSTKRMMLVK